MRTRLSVLITFAVVMSSFLALSNEAEARGGRRGRCCCCPPPCCYRPIPQCFQAPAIQFPTARQVVINGRTYYVVATDERNENEEEELLNLRTAVGRRADIPEWDIFDGKVRKIAKVTIFDGETKSFDSIGDLRAWLPDDDDMRDLHIGRGPDVNRIQKGKLTEKLNVTVPAYIYTFCKESDNDYHVIIGDAPGTPNRKYMNAEVSGIPDIGTDDNRDKLSRVRRLFKQSFELENEGPDSYHRLPQPVPVTITGSLFWDVEHYPRTVGPSFASPKTAWEIHPISKIEFPE